MRAAIYILVMFKTRRSTPGGGGGEALRYRVWGRDRSLSKLKNTPKALISGQKNTLILIKMLIFSSK